MHLSSPPYVPHALPISIFLTSSPEWYLVMNTKHKAFYDTKITTPHLKTLNSIWTSRISVQCKYAIHLHNSRQPPLDVQHTCNLHITS
jgi:hypothetical protein